MTKEKIKIETKYIGCIPVDSGKMMFSDPCYVLPNKDFPESNKDIPDYRDFISTPSFDEYAYSNAMTKKTIERYKNDTVAVISTGFGDGLYPVEVEIGDFGKWGKRVVSAKIVFIEESECYEESELWFQ